MSSSTYKSSDQDPKLLGAFYTDVAIAEFLVWWTLRSDADRVIDPSFGGGVFLVAAAERLRLLGGSSKRQVFGVELDREVHETVTASLLEEDLISPSNLFLSDFFDFRTESEPRFDAVVGNPPFIRFHRFTGESREKALDRAAEAGVTLSQLCSSWAPFLVHSVRMLRQGGRLGMVIPTEIMHAAYAQPVLHYLQSSFRKLTLLTFRQKLFADLNEDTLLLLADERKDGAQAVIRLQDLESFSDLLDIESTGDYGFASAVSVNSTRLRAGTERLIEYLIPKRARELYRELRDGSLCRRLGEVADVGIGYVTGANSFFHLSVEAVVRKKIAPRYLARSVWRGRAFYGLRFTVEDWEKAISTSDAGFLLSLTPQTTPIGDLADYLNEGERNGVPTGFKCRNRRPWFVVPHVYTPDGFLSYMSGGHPRLVVNNADAVAPNTLHILRLRRRVPSGIEAIAALWQTSLAHLSVEVEGHSMGGGMLKLEPTEAERVCLPMPERVKDIRKIAAELDELLRADREEALREVADHRILRQLGLSRRDCAILEDAADVLRSRRTSRGVKNGTTRRDSNGRRFDGTEKSGGKEALVGDSL